MPSGYGQSAPDFGAAANFVLFTVTGAVGNTGTSYITGDIGTDTGAITGFEAPSVVDGATHTPDSVTMQASADLVAAYNQLSGMMPTNTNHTAAFGGGETLIPGVYAVTTTATIGGTLILDAQGNSDALFVFKFNGALTSSAEAKVLLLNGALAEHVFWLAEGAIALAAQTEMKGILIANHAANSMAAGGSLLGRMYSTTGAIAVDASTVANVANGNGLNITSHQTLCSDQQPQDLTLSINPGIVLRWQQSTDAMFTTPLTIANTSSLLTGAAIGNLTTTAYFRAVVQMPDASVVTSNYASVAIYSTLQPDFGSVSQFVLFTSNGAVGNTGTSQITGDVGTNFGIISGFESPSMVHGSLYNADANTAQAATDLIAAYQQLRTLVNTNVSHAAVFGNGETLTGGVYFQPAASTVNGTLTLDAQGNAATMFVFKIDGAFSAGVGTTIILSNGALSEHVFWIVEGAIAMGASTTMYGTMIAHDGAISMGADGTMYGRMFSTGGAVATNSTLAVAVGQGVAGSVSGNQTLCEGLLPANLTLSGNTGAVIKWQKSIDAGFTDPIDIAGNASTLTGASIGLLETTTYFRAVVKKGLCGTADAAYTTITVIPEHVGLSGPRQVICKSTKPDNINLVGQVGNVVRWESASNATFTTDLNTINTSAATLTSESMGILTDTKYYRAVIQTAGCGLKYSNAVEILIPPAATYANGAWDSAPTAKSAVLINSDLTLAGNLHVCTCQVNNTATLTIPSGLTLIVQRDLTVASTATLTVANNGSLVQVADEAQANGIITVLRNTAPMKQYDYTYWSAPVQQWQLNQLSPNTLADKFYSWNPLINNWNPLNGGNAIMQQGVGYIVRAPQGWSTTNASTGVYAGSFTGTPNTGVVPVQIQKGSGTFNLIGNPYPSAIDIDLFLNDPANVGVFNGTVYIWTHNSAISSTIPGNNVYNYTSDDYAKYNLTGGVKTASSAVIDGAVPDGKIAAGQGFFIEANSALGNGSYPAQFNNSMRIVGHNDQFYRPGIVTPVNSALQKNRLWISLSNTQGAYNETLLGYVSGATNSFDALYDGKTFPSANVLSLYSILGAENCAIQGRALPFNADEIIPLGYKSTIDGTFTMAIEQFEGLFQNQTVYVLDKLDNSMHNLKTGHYTFASGIGTFNTRFELRFTDVVLAKTNPVYNSENVFIGIQEGTLVIKSLYSFLDEVKIYDLTGRLLLDRHHINSAEMRWSRVLSPKVLIVVVTLANQKTITKKIVY